MTTYDDARRILDRCARGLCPSGAAKSSEVADGRRVCCPCWNEHVTAWRAARKAELATLPRCEVPGCEHRGTWQFTGGVLLCGWHARTVKTHVQRLRASMGGLGLFVAGPSLDAGDVLRIAQGGNGVRSRSCGRMNTESEVRHA